eukprot:COSAG04_NODE_300_length_17427_cov_16.169725_9_plen_212_part_00
MRRFWAAEGSAMEKIYGWVRSLAEAKLEYSVFWSAAEPQAQQQPEPPQDAAAAPAPAAAATSVELTTGSEGGGAVLCLITGEVFEPGPFEKPLKVARLRPKKGPPQRIGWRQGNSFAPLLALGGGLPEEQLAAAGRWEQVRASMRPDTRSARPISGPSSPHSALCRCRRVGAAGHSAPRAPRATSRTTSQSAAAGAGGARIATSAAATARS